jgi:hypothetical protein
MVLTVQRLYKLLGSRTGFLRVLYGCTVVRRILIDTGQYLFARELNNCTTRADPLFRPVVRGFRLYGDLYIHFREGLYNRTDIAVVPDCHILGEIYC